MVDFKLETDKNNRNKADSEFNEGVFLGYAWRSTEYLIASKGAIYKCRTVRRRADEIAFDVALIDNLEIRFEEYTLKGAKTTMHISFPKTPGGDGPALIPTRGPGMVPRRVYLMPSGFAKHGFTQGCPGCIYAQNGNGLKRNHSENCRKIMEEEIAKIASDT